MSTLNYKWPEIPGSAAPDVPYYVNELAALIDAALKAVADASTAATTPTTLAAGQNLDALPEGRYRSFSAAISSSLVNRPPEGLAAQAALLEVRSANTAGTVVVQVWQIIPNALDPAISWTRHRDSAGTWSAWRVTTGAHEIKAGIDVYTLHPGTYIASTAARAQSIINRPPDAMAGQAAIVTAYGTGIGLPRIVRWQILPNAAEPPLVWESHRDTAGTWSTWRQKDGAETLEAGANLAALRPGRYVIPSAEVAGTLGAGPTGALAWAIGPAVVEVIGNDVQTRRQTLSTTPAGQPSRTIARHRDTAGHWTPWAEFAPTPPAPTGEAALPTLAPLAAVEHQHMRGIARLTLETAPDLHPARWTAPAGARLTTPTHDGSGQATHPKVLHLPAGYGPEGHPYWIALTGYASANDALEDPEILSSADGIAWTVPAGAVNPLDDLPGSPDRYNSDTHLVHHDGTLYLIWREVDVIAGGQEHIWQRTSTDGVNWTVKREIYTPASPGTVYGMMLSPTLLKTATGWRMYFVAGVPDPNRLVYIETTMPEPGPSDWTAPVRCDFAGSDFHIIGRDLWHIDIVQDAAGYWALLNDCERRTGGLNGDLYLARSEDGESWHASPVPLMPRYGTGHDALYRGSLVPTGTGAGSSFEIYYSARVSENQRWHIYRTTADRDC